MKSLLSTIKNLLVKPFVWFKKQSLKKKIFIIILLLILLYIIIKATSTGSNQKGNTTVKVTRTDITETVSESGRITVNGRTDIFSPATGVVEEVYVDNDDVVAEGDVLFKVKSTATEQEKSQALSAYLAAKTSLDAANANAYSLRSIKDTAWKRYYDLAVSDEFENADGSPRDDMRNSSAEFQSAQAEWMAAESNFKNQTSAISQAQAASSSTYLLYQATQNAEIKATVDGTVSNLSVTVGSSVQPGTLTVPAAPLASISSASRTELVVYLSENDIAKVKEQQKADVEVKAINNKKYNGIVRRVDRLGTDQLGVIRYSVYIEIMNPDNQIRPGMNVDVIITTNTINNVLAVPNSAVKPYQGGRAVRILSKDNTVEYLPVEIGIRGDKNTQIVKGLKENQEIITSLSNEQIKRPGFFGN